MRTISTQLLKTRLDGGDPPLLVMTMDENAFRRAHIPGSIRVDGADTLAQLDDLQAEIVLYCSSPDCYASRMAYRQMESAGYSNLWHYSGGLSEWDAEGLPLDRE